MKKLIILAALPLFTFGCGAFGMNAYIYTGVTQPVNATSNEAGSKKGVASCFNVLGIAAAGNCSIDEAARNGGIKKIKTVDMKRTSVLGLFVKDTTIVTGE